MGTAAGVESGPTDPLVAAILHGLTHEDDADRISFPSANPQKIDPAHILLPPDTEPGESDAEDDDWDAP